MIEGVFELALEILFSALPLPRRRTRQRSLLPQVWPQHVRGQRILLERWGEKRRLVQIDSDTWRGKVGRFEVCIRTVMRSEGALPLHIEVYGVPGLEDLHAPWTAAPEDPDWKEVFLALPTLERIRLFGEGGLEFRLPWNTQPSALDALLELLEARFQSAQATYR